MIFSESPATSRPSVPRSGSDQLLQGIIDTAREAVFVVDDAMRIKPKAHDFHIETPAVTRHMSVTGG